MSNSVTLSMVGLSTQEGTVVNVAANLLAAMDVAVKVLDNGDLSGDIVLVDGGSVAGRGVLGRLDGRQKALLFVDSDSDAKGSNVIVRPVRVQALRDALSEVMAALPAKRVQPPAPVGKAQTTTASAQQQAPSAQPLPGTFFYLLLDTVVNRSLLRVDCGGGTTVLIHGPTQCIYTHADGMSLEKMSQQNYDMLKSQKLSETEFMQATKGMSLTRLHDVLWLAERHGGRGQLLPGHSAEVPVRLKVWPKFNNRHVRPENLKLAAMMSKQPLSLRTLAVSSGVALPQVIDFYNSAVAFGVIEKHETAQPVTPPPKPSSSGGLLGKIARRLALKRD